MKKFFRFFQQPCLSISSLLTSMFFAILVEAAWQLWGKKPTILFSIKIFLTHLLIILTLSLLRARCAGPKKPQFFLRTHRAGSHFYGIFQSSTTLNRACVASKNGKKLNFCNCPQKPLQNHAIWSKVTEF